LKNDFKIKRFNNKQRPNSVAWELGKSSPRMSTSTLIKTTAPSQKNPKSHHANSQTHAAVTSNDNDSEGFKEFLPYSSTNTSMGVKSKNKRYLNCDFDEEDEDEEMMEEEEEEENLDDDDEYGNYADIENDLKEFIYVLKEKKSKRDDEYDDDDDYNDPIDLLNHETFSDMQSINTEDMSFNAMSLSPPIPLSKFNKNATTAQSPPSAAAAAPSYPHPPPLNQSLLLDQSFLLQNQSGFDSVMSINEQNQQFYFQQFPLLMPATSSYQNNHLHSHHQQQHPPNAPNSPLNNSLAFNGANGGGGGGGGGSNMTMQKPPGYFGASSLFSNPSELSPFNYQTNKFNATYNFYGNNNNNNHGNKDSLNQMYFNNFSESLDNNANSSVYDESSSVHPNRNGKENAFYKTYDNDDEFELGYLRNQSWVISYFLVAL